MGPRPTNANEIKQIEVIRGPASAVWGANAMSSIINVIALTPRELAASGGSSLTIGAGFFDRDVTGPGQRHRRPLLRQRHARASRERQVVLQAVRRVIVPGRAAAPHKRDPNSFNTPYPPYNDSGTSQPKFDARVNYELANSGKLVFSGGSPAPRASFTAASAPSTSIADRD